MNSAKIDIVAFDSCYLEDAVGLSLQAGWPHRAEDWRMALDLSAGVIALDERGKVVGTAMTTNYKNECATINMIIVDVAKRGQGLGRKLTNAALMLAAERSLQLVATKEGMPLYKRLGFRQVGVIAQHQGVAGGILTSEIVSFEAEPDLEAFALLDKLAFGADRSEMLARLTVAGPFATLRRKGEIVGFAGLREFGHGEVIGPVVAQSQEDAKALIAFCLISRTNKFLRIDTTEAAGLSDWLSGLGLKKVGGGIAMRKGNLLTQISKTFKTFALTNQALG